MNQGLLFLIFIWNINLFSQAIEYFNLLPDIGAVKSQSQFKAVSSDSNHIYILGDMVTSQDSNGRNKKIEIISCVFDYHGNIINVSILNDVTITKAYIGNNQPFFKLNDSIHYYLFLSDKTPLKNYADIFFVKINIVTGVIVKSKYIPPPVSEDLIFYDYTQGQIIGNTALLVFKCESPTFSENYIYEIDSVLNIVKKIKIPKDSARKDICRWITKNLNNTYEIVGDAYQVRNGNLIDSANIFYLKIDSTGGFLKRRELKLLKNIFIGSGQTYTINRNRDNSYVISAIERNPQLLTNGIPYFIYASSELDTVQKLTKMYEFNKLDQSSINFLTYTTKMNDGSGYVTCGSFSSPPFNEPDYGILFKNSVFGDSVWTRKFQPLGWDSIRAWWMDFNQVTCTPYNTLAICARVADGSEGVIKGWILHLDKDGCLVPGCITSVNDIDKGKKNEAMFKIYPNPIMGDYCYLLSKIHENNCLIQLTDASGKVLLNRKFIAEKDVQYILELPQGLANAIYYIKVKSKEIEYEQKVILTRK